MITVLSYTGVEKFIGELRVAKVAPLSIPEIWFEVTSFRIFPEDSSAFQ